jgi:hypothetical protein
VRIQSARCCHFTSLENTVFSASPAQFRTLLDTAGPVNCSAHCSTHCSAVQCSVQLALHSSQRGK